jgi:excisionase family DNA binding protein
MHPITVRREIAAGRLRAAHAGRKGHYRISRADVETWWRSRGGGVLFDDNAMHENFSGEFNAAGHLADFLAQAEALTRRLEKAGAGEGKPFAGVDGSEMVRAGRAERGNRLNGEA